MVPSAELRIFQPLEAFPADEQAHWERFIVSGAHLRAPARRYRQRLGLHRLGILSPAEQDGAHVRVVDGRTYVCPWRTRLRVLAALLSFREVAPLEEPAAFIPDADARRAARELSRLRRRRHGISFVMQSPWHVPVRWFVLFDDAERSLVEEGAHFRLRYRTRAARAIRRAERAIPALRKTDLGPVADVILELHEWLSAFDRSSLIELEYGGLCDLLTWDELDDDHSARDVQQAIESLAKGDFPRSAEVYQGVVTRWADVRSRETLN